MDKKLEKFLREIDKMKLHVANGKPALKKPLLLLLVISKFELGEFMENRISFREIEKELTELIKNYGGRPSSSDVKANHPFQYLNSSSFWDLNLPKGVKMTHSRDLPKSVLRSTETYATLDEELYKLLKTSRKARAILSRFILNKWWTETIQEELIKVLNLPINIFSNELKITRNRNFTESVLANFRYRCAFCGFAAFFNNNVFGLDGAHIRWFSYDGPDTVDNGLALCKFHHWAFDRGVLSVHPETLEILVSSKFVGQDDNSIALIEGLKGRKLLKYKDIRPKKTYLEWHNDSIFID